jgi:hypothetical protein
VAVGGGGGLLKPIPTDKETLGILEVMYTHTRMGVWRYVDIYTHTGAYVTKSTGGLICLRNSLGSIIPEVSKGRKGQSCHLPVTHMLCSLGHCGFHFNQR